LSRSSLSRRYITATVRKLQTLQERRLDGYDVVVLMLGLTVQGDKALLGFTETGTEYATTCADLLRGLGARGVRDEAGSLVVVEGSKGLRAAVAEVFGPETPVQRCTDRGRENIAADSPKSAQAPWRRKLAAAYAQPTYDAATAALDALRADLRQLNESALRSPDEGRAETLALHRLGVSPAPRRSLATTNMLESMFSLVEARTGKVDWWRTRNQKQRWLAAALLDVELRLRRARGYRALPELCEALQKQRNGLGSEPQQAVAS
jgi:putative transposase